MTKTVSAVPDDDRDEVETFIAAVKLIEDAGFIITDPRKATRSPSVRGVISRAIADPGAIVGDRGRLSLVAWQTDAVMTALTFTTPSVKAEPVAWDISEAKRIAAELRSVTANYDIIGEAADFLENISTTPPPLEAETVSSIDYQQHKGAPMTFYAHEMDQWWKAEATRDDASTKDCMYAALQHLDELLSIRSLSEAGK